ncbi:hypothetical protein HNV12_03460 [Methanococcoides sp. SA1]|nr:hypothetical protein [Methanococcoides sp. SA1]
MKKRFLIYATIFFLGLILIFFMISQQNSNEIEELRENSMKFEDTQEGESLQLAIKNNNLEECESLEEEYQEECKITFTITKAISQNDISICEEIEGQGEKAHCIDSIYFKRAVDDSNLISCEEIISEDTKEYCKEVINSNQ